MTKWSEKISEEQLLKLLSVFNEKRLNYKIIFKLCKVEKLLDLTVRQYNYLLYLISK